MIPLAVTVVGVIAPGDATYAVVANFVLLSFGLCVVAVVPPGNAGVPLKFAAVPEVFAALFGMSPLTSAGNCA
jgi:hypothetical protein